MQGLGDIIEMFDGIHGKEKSQSAHQQSTGIGFYDRRQHSAWTGSQYRHGSQVGDRDASEIPVRNASKTVQIQYRLQEDGFSHAEQTAWGMSVVKLNCIDVLGIPCFKFTSSVLGTHGNNAQSRNPWQIFHLSSPAHMI